MEIFDIIFWFIGNLLQKAINKLFGFRLNLGDGGKVVLGFLSIVVMVFGIFLIMQSLKVLIYD